VNVSNCPREGVKIVSSMMGSRLPGGIISPVVATDLPLEVVPSLVVDFFFGVMTWWKGFLRMSLVEEKSGH